MNSVDIFYKLSKNTKFKSARAADNKLNGKAIVNEGEIAGIPTCHMQATKMSRIQSEECEESITLYSNIKSTGFSMKSDIKRKKNVSKLLLAPLEKQILQEKEIVNRFRNLNNINVLGGQVAKPLTTFAEMKIREELLINLSKCNYLQPTPIQMQAIPILLESRNLLACAPTGSGKTVAFMLPIIHHLHVPKSDGFRGLVICPTRELAKQTQRECSRLAEDKGFRIHIVSNVNKAQLNYGPNSTKRYDILITTPNRLCHLLSLKDGLKLNNIQWLVIDEADKLFEDGQRCFRKQLDSIIAACTNSSKRVAMFSATCTPQVVQWCNKHLKQLIRVTVGQRNTSNSLVVQKLLYVGSESGKLVAFRDLIRTGLKPPVLIFVQSKERAQELFTELLYDGIHVDAIHADRTQQQRANTVQAFREGHIWVLICTELMARGIDFTGINLVVNYDFPSSAISYVHRVGRTGRAGRCGKAVSFFTDADIVNLRSIATVLKQSGCEVPDYMLMLKKRKKKDLKQLKISALKRETIRCKIFNKLKTRKENLATE